MTPLSLPTMSRSLFIMVFILLYSNFLNAQDQCLSIDKTYPNQERKDKLLHGDFNGDRIQDLVLVPQNNKGAIRLMYGSLSGLKLKDSVVLNNFYHVSSPADFLNDGYDDLLISISNEIHFYNGTPIGLIRDENYTIYLNQYPGLTGTGAKGYAEPYADQNEDGLIEILLTGGGGENPLNNGGILALLQAENLKLNILKSYSGEDLNSVLNMKPIVLGDMNGDGFTEVAFERMYGLLEVYYGSAEYFTAENKLSLFGEFEYNLNLTNVGDVNGDGFNDLLVSQTQNDRNYPNAWIYLGSSKGLSERPIWTSNSGHPDYKLYEGFGKASGPLGDINNDGFDDFFISGNNSIYTYIYYGASNPILIKKGPRFGLEPYQLIKAGDLNGDNYEDYATTYYNPGTKIWEIGLIEGSLNGLNLIACFMSDRPIALTFNAKFGQGAGDVNKDGFADIVLGHDDLDPLGNFESGKIEVVTGASEGTGLGGMIYRGDDPRKFGDQYGNGDFNGDGFSDVIAGKFYNTRIVVFYGSEKGMKNQPDTSLIEDDYLGWGRSIEEVGDLNNDGFDDFLSYGERGMTLVLGSSIGPTIFQDWEFNSF